eukprot:1160808-Pelagomonas_calceolata.AAC.9
MWGRRFNWEARSMVCMEPFVPNATQAAWIVETGQQKNPVSATASPEKHRSNPRVKGNAVVQIREQTTPYLHQGLGDVIGQSPDLTAVGANHQGVAVILCVQRAEGAHTGL